MSFILKDNLNLQDIFVYLALLNREIITQNFILCKIKTQRD